MTKKNELLEWIKTIVIAGIIAIIVIQFIAPTVVKERSMEPSFYESDYLLINKQSYNISEPARGDVIVFESHIPLDESDLSKGSKLLIKRIIGVPGDKIDVKDGDVYINDKKADEPYIKDGYTAGEVSGFTVPKNSYYCMGDNRLVSVDSRSERVGCVSKDAIVGKVFVRLYPFDSFGLIKSRDPLGEK
ncbi:MAG: signal peptidase I [Peptostreptococcaceae bacterium]|nr:signal peptidase I [Peptostreptococcaceae bacterium]